MFGSIGFQEIIVIFLVALVFIGPSRLPELAKTIGRSLRDFKRATSDLQDQFSLEDDLDIEPPETEKIPPETETEPSPGEEADPETASPSSPERSSTGSSAGDRAEPPAPTPQERTSTS